MPSQKNSRGLGCWLGLFLAAWQVTAIAADSPWQRVVVIGASASGGFVLSEPFGGTNTDKCKLHHYLAAAIAAPHAPVKNLGTALFFLSPDAIGAQQIEAATNHHPTLVVAVDFLFWFCYGQGDTDEERRSHFEDGLNLLGKISAPLLVGDIPDASAATNSGIISPAQVPREPVRLAANARLKKWAAAHPQVTVVPLAEFMRAVKRNEAVKIHGQTIAAGQTRSCLQADGLHPAPRGAAVLALAIWDSLTKSQPKFSPGEICWDVNKVLRRGSPAGP